MAKPIIKINIDSVSWYCDDCGYIDDGYVTITFPNGKELHACKDGHFGYSNWHGEISQIYLWILESLGYSLFVNKKPYYAPHSKLNDSSDSYEISELFMGPLQPIYLETVMETEPFDENIEYLEFEECIIRFPHQTLFYGNKEGMITIDNVKENIYRKIVEEYVIIDYTETENIQEINSYDDYDEEENE